MPTTLPRTTITHTPPVALLLSIAEHRWPGQTPGQQMIRLMETGAAALAPEEQQRRIQALELAATEINGAYGHAYEDDYLERLRAEW